MNISFHRLEDVTRKFERNPLPLKFPVHHHRGSALDYPVKQGNDVNGGTEYPGHTRLMTVRVH
jgi:hypothetical protein